MDIPEKDLEDAIRFTGAKTKKDAVVTALAEFNHRRRLAEAAKLLGTSSTFMPPKDLAKSRRQRRVS